MYLATPATPALADPLGLEQRRHVRLGSVTVKRQELIADLQRSVNNQYFDEMPMPELCVDDVDIQAANNCLPIKTA